MSKKSKETDRLITFSRTPVVGGNLRALSIKPPPDGGLLCGLGVADLRADPWLFYMLITTYPRSFLVYYA
jgi:hypothetical protein